MKNALEIARERGYKQKQANAYIGLGYTSSLINQIQPAIQHFEKALDILARERRYKLQETNAYLGLGDTFRRNNQIQPAIQHLEKALEIARERGYKEEETVAYTCVRTYFQIEQSDSTGNSAI